MELLLPPQVALGCLDGGVAEKKLDLIEGAPERRQSFAHVRRKSVGRELEAKV